ncbi:MAG TPA: ABC transporter permease subunit [Bacteroidota bacterium]|nr:ABC transporter permease subunit [Bacteroidota bacterium]
MSITPVIHIARQELTINIRNRWTAIFAVVFGALVVSLAFVGMKAEGFSGMQSFTRTSASILNLVLYIVPLVSLTMGTLSFTGDKGSTELLFSQPVLASEIVVGKMLGLFGSIALAMISGFVIAGGIIATQSTFEGLASYVIFVALSLALSLVFLSLALFVSTLARRKAKAFGVSLFLWFFFVLFYDLVAIGFTLLLKGSSANFFLFLSLFGNPVDLVRVASLIIFDNVTIFGPAGAAVLRFLGGPFMSVLLLVAAILVWVVAPVVFSARLMKRQDF